MTKKTALLAIAAFFLTAFLPAQQINVKFGLFAPFQKSDLWEDNFANLSFEKQDFNHTVFALEYQQQFHNHFSIYIEGSRYRRSIESDYREYEYDDGSPILQTMHLAITSIETGVKINLLPYKSKFSPFVAAGAGLYFWQYEQFGDFIDFTDFDVYDGFADQEAIALGFHVKGGISMRFTRGLGLIIEAKVHWAKGELGEYFEGFEPFDLSALSLLAGFQFYF